MEKQKVTASHLTVLAFVSVFVFSLGIYLGGNLNPGWAQGWMVSPEVEDTTDESSVDETIVRNYRCKSGQARFRSGEQIEIVCSDLDKYAELLSANGIELTYSHVNSAYGDPGDPEDDYYLFLNDGGIDLIKAKGLNNLIDLNSLNTLRALFLDEGSFSQFSIKLPESIKFIELKDGQLQSFSPVNISELANLYTIVLRGNQIESFNFAMFPGPLNYLSLDQNNLTQEGLQRFGKNNIKMVNLDNNPELGGLMTSIPGSTKSLSMANTGIGSLVDIPLLSSSSINGLGLGYNSLTEIDISQLPDTIESLGLDGNQLTSLDISLKPSLKFLYINDNQLSDISFTKTARESGLISLSLRNNLLTSIDPEQFLSNIDNMETLDIFNNCIYDAEQLCNDLVDNGDVYFCIGNENFPKPGCVE